MRKPNFSKLSTAVLEGYKADIDSELAAREKSSAKKEKVLAKMRSLAKAEGLDLESLLDDAPARKTGSARKTTSKVAPKYQNPKNSAEKWTGRGRQPKWVAAYLAKSGTKLEQLLIKK
ncbi:MAG: H-NS family nucleoid-associated regulatory protein [Granulosicoccaceae bacterium]